MNLLEELKNYLDITWTTTEEEDKKLEGMLKRGMAELGGKIGGCDFDGDTPEKTLLFVRIMYERASALDRFWINYGGEIISLQVDRMVNRDEGTQ